MISKYFQLLILIIIFQLIGNKIYCQKHDFNWLLGYDISNDPNDTIQGISEISFNTISGNPIVKYLPESKLYYLDGYGSMISDEHGKYKFAYDCYKIEDYNYKFIEHSTKICPDLDCVANNQGSCIIPKPNSPSSYCLFNIQDTLAFFPDTVAIFGNVYNYNELIETANGLQLSIIKKEIVRDTMALGQVSFCKHANGRDWWILIPGVLNNKFYTFLLTPDGVIDKGEQTVGMNRKDGTGFSCFSNDGKYYCSAIKVTYSTISLGEFDFYQFDRSTGRLSNHQNFKTDTTESLANGCAFSPDSKILYVCSGAILYQYPIVNGRLDRGEVIDIYDGYLSYNSPGFYGQNQFGQLQIAPDGRIYCHTDFVQTRHIHVINKPNKLGKACNFKQHSFPLPTIKATAPYFPNYRLGPIDGSTCDTLGIDNIPWCWWRYDQDTIDHLMMAFTDLSAYEVTDWHWTFGDGATSSEINPTHRYNKNGIYEVCLIVSNKYGADTLCRTLNLGTTNSVDVNPSIATEFFPNPCHEYAIININNYIPEYMECKIMNNLGITLQSQRIYQGSNRINTTSLAQGIYYATIVERNKLVKTIKVIKN